MWKLNENNIIPTDRNSLTKNSSIILIVSNILFTWFEKVSPEVVNL
jgi:hypothetical protein